MEDWGNFLHQILEEDSAQIKVFLQVWRFSGKQQRLVAATGGRGWWRKRCQALGGVLEKTRVKNRVFHAEERIYNLQISLSKLISLRGSPLFHLVRQFMLSATPSALRLAQRNSLTGWNCAQHALLAQQDIKNCYFQNPNGHTMKRFLRKLQTKFEDDPTVNKSKILILLKQVWVKFEIS